MPYRMAARYRRLHEHEDRLQYCVAVLRERVVTLESALQDAGVALDALPPGEGPQR